MVFIICILLIIMGVILLQIKGITSYIGDAFIILSFSLPDLYYAPGLNDDLGRYFAEMKFVSQFNNIHSLLYSYKYIDEFNYHAGEPLYNIFQWSISRTGIFNLLPVLIVFIVYLSFFLPFVYLRNANKLSFIGMIFGFLLIAILMPYSQITSTVRWCLASGLFFVITFFTLQIKNNHKIFMILLYIPLVLIHEALIMPIILIGICMVLPKIKWHYYIIFLIFLSFILLFILHVESSPSNSIFGIAHTYSQSNFSWGNSGSAIVGFISMWIIPYIYSVGSFYLLKDNKQLENFTFDCNMYILFNLTNLMLSPFIIVSQRYAVFVGFINILLLIDVIKNKGFVRNLVYLLNYFSLFVGLFTLFLSITHMTFNFSNIVHY